MHDSGAGADALAAQLLATSRGDQLSFAHLYDILAPRIFGLVHQILEDASRSQEVTEAVFLELWQVAGRFDPERGTALNWALTIARRRALEHVARTGSLPIADATDARVRCPGTPVVEETHTDTWLWPAQTGAVRVALASLSPTQRQAVELAYFGGHTHCELSEVLSVPIGTAKTELRAGMERLRSLLPDVGACGCSCSCGCA
jgi:RNA polymerase sigma-70 factor (ECF subfamily)